MGDPQFLGEEQALLGGLVRYHPPQAKDGRQCPEKRALASDPYGYGGRISGAGWPEAQPQLAEEALRASF